MLPKHTIIYLISNQLDEGQPTCENLNHTSVPVELGMQITLTLILDRDELHWINMVREAYKLAGSPNPDYELEYNPFQEILSNHFLIDDVYMAKSMLEEAYEKQLQFQKNKESDFGRSILANCLKAQESFDDFYRFCLKGIGEFNNDDYFLSSDDSSYK